MSDDESRHEHLPTEGDEIFTENGSETVENDQTGLPPWAAAVTAQIQKVFTEQLEDHLAAQAQANRAELQDLIEECRASARTARLATGNCALAGPIATGSDRGPTGADLLWIL